MIPSRRPGRGAGAQVAAIRTAAANPVGVSSLGPLWSLKWWFGSGRFEFGYAFQLLCDGALGQLQVVGRLKIEPVLR